MEGGLELKTMSLNDTAQTDLDESAAEIFALFMKRETEFGFVPDITIDYPDIAASGEALFLTAPVAYIDARIAALSREGDPIAKVVILTTFGDRLTAALVAAGYRSTRIDMPAGPDFTFWFERDIPGVDVGRTLYLEAVNETDEKIRPNFSLELRDKTGALRGGACGSIHDREDERYAYLATMTLDICLPTGTGAKLAEALLDFLRSLGVATVHLGTQTAGPFYQKLGFQITHTVLPRLRFRNLDDGAKVFTDLVMLERRL